MHTESAVRALNEQQRQHREDVIHAAMIRAGLCAARGLSESQACHPPGCDAGVTTTGWPAGMLQDDSRELSRWLAGRAGARQCARAAAEKCLLPAGHTAGFAQAPDCAPALGAFLPVSDDTEGGSHD